VSDPAPMECEQRDADEKRFPSGRFGMTAGGGWREHYQQGRIAGGLKHPPLLDCANFEDGFFFGCGAIGDDE
jgi:hypothetical protein